MSNAVEHRIGAAAIVGWVLFACENREGKMTLGPLGGALLAALCTNIPDILEPAAHPHHRQFFHSVTFAGLLGYVMYKVYKWEPETESDKLLRFGLLASGAGILIHLALDSGTPRSLPLFGKI